MKKLIGFVVVVAMLVFATGAFAKIVELPLDIPGLKVTTEVPSGWTITKTSPGVNSYGVMIQRGKQEIFSLLILDIGNTSLYNFARTVAENYGVSASNIRYRNESYFFVANVNGIEITTAVTKEGSQGIMTTMTGYSSAMAPILQNLRCQRHVKDGKFIPLLTTKKSVIRFYRQDYTVQD